MIMLRCSLEPDVAVCLYNNALLMFSHVANELPVARLQRQHDSKARHVFVSAAGPIDDTGVQSS
jgi:hypothetical protein